MNTGSAENIAVRDNPDELRYELLVDDDVVGEIRFEEPGRFTDGTRRGGDRGS